jgi:DNA-binding transcriptional MerR regulator
MQVSDTRPLRVGEVARATGLTVRTLHHYDEIGLLVPSERSGAGYRLYGAGDVRRLYRILALRGMGFTLDEIAATLEREGDDPRQAVRRHIDRLDEQLRLTRRLRDRLTRILDVLDQAGEPSTDQFIDAIEVMTMIERYYTPEQLERLEQRAQEVGDEGMQRAQAEWAELIAAVEAERAASIDPADPRLDPLVERWTGLIEQFTGGDPGIRESLQRMYENEGPERASRGAVDAATMEYAQRAIQARQRA